MLTKLSVDQHKTVSPENMAACDINDQLELYSTIDFDKKEKSSKCCVDFEQNYFICSSLMAPTCHSSPKEAKNKSGPRKKDEKRRLTNQPSFQSRSKSNNENIEQFYLNLDNDSVDLGFF